MQDFVFLENHTVYSLCEGTIFIDQLVAHAVRHKFKYLAICDTNSFYGLINFIRAVEAASLKPLVAVRMEHGDTSAVLLARSMRGYAYICDILTALRMEEDFDLRERLISRGTSEYFIITHDRELLKALPEALVEVNTLRKNFFADYRWALQNTRRPVLLHPVYYEKAEDHGLHRLLRAVHHNKKIGALNAADTRDARAFFVSPEDIQRSFNYMPEALAGAAALAKEACFPFQHGSLIFPDAGPDSFSQLRRACLEALPLRYRDPGREVRDRLSRELEVIKKTGFADYFLVVADIVRHAGRYTVGRGSGAASIVSYLLYITHVDPIRHNLFFERFLNEARPDPPDIDIDFAWDEKDRITEYVFQAHPKRAAMVANHITFSTRSSLHEIAKVYGLTEKEIMSITRNISHYYDKEKDAFIKVNEQRADRDKWGDIIRQAVRINGIPRFIGLHCGGVVITPRPVRYYVPVERSNKGFTVMSWEKDQCEDFGLVKIDLLGNRSLAVVRDTICALKDNYGVELKYEDLDPLDDSYTIRAIERGETLGCFYIESPATRQLQKKARRGDYEHLVIHSSIIRPAANAFINEYIRRLHGEPWEPLIPGMEEILSETYGIMVYQEDISKIAIKFAGFAIGEADELRKVISNRKRVRRRNELKEKFYTGLKRRGIELDKIKSIWEMIESFSGYSFCKPHSASYALLSFKAVYLKINYPAEFMAAVLSNQGGFYGPLAYISEARRLGITVHTPDINHSFMHYLGKDREIWAGFMVIKDLSRLAVESLIRERESGGRYLGLLDFMRRTGTGKSDTLVLIRSGCFDRLEDYNRASLTFLAGKYHAMKQSIPDGEAGEDIKVPAFKDSSPTKKIASELQSFGFILSSHPMTRLRESLVAGCVRGSEIDNHRGKKILTAGIMVTSKTVMTKNDDLMKFVSFEDETALYECVLFPKVYKKYAAKLEYLRAYYLRGRVDTEFGVSILNVYELKKID